jgi:hypothetical protein
MAPRQRLTRLVRRHADGMLWKMARFGFLITAVAAAFLLSSPQASSGTTLPLVDDVSREHLEEHAARIVQTLETLGDPIAHADRARLEAAAQELDEQAIEVIQRVLDPYCLVGIHIDDEAWLKVQPASFDPEARRLVRKKWRTFLVKVYNEGTVTTPLEVTSPQTLLPSEITQGDIPPQISLQDSTAWSRWIGLKWFQAPPMQKNLSGKHLDYMVLQLYSRDAGVFAADLIFNLGGGQIARGHYADTSILFYVSEDEFKR